VSTNDARVLSPNRSDQPALLASTLTPKVLRRDLEKELNLDEGDLDAPEFRNAVKAAIETTMVC
jgi:hypothetical protein